MSDEMDSEAQRYADQLRAAYDAEAPAPPADVVVSDAFWYIHFKGFAFLKAGADDYRNYDAFGLPSIKLPATRLDAIARLCEQIVRCRGLSSDRPLTGIDVDGFYTALRMFHFDHFQHVALQTETAGMILDEMQMKHVVDGRELTLYNLVTVNVNQSQERGDAGPPCPYCGKPLRTAFAKQCRHCGMDWHDPANVVRRKASPDS